MDRIWIGDFHFNPFETFYKIEEQSDDTSDSQAESRTGADYYIIEDSATQTWLETEAAVKLEDLTPLGSNIIIMVGLQDCINSCLYSIDIKNIARNYIDTLNAFKDNYQGNIINFCSVPPVSGDFSGPEKNITAEELNKQINAFNKEIQENCSVEFLDCNDYLIKTNFKTRDGIHYISEVSKGLESFIIHNLKTTSVHTVASFIPRRKAPIVEIYSNDIDDEDGGLGLLDVTEDYWIQTSYGGKSPFPRPKNAFRAGCTLPNCTAYAWGRFYEIIGERPNLSTSNAGDWFTYNDGYKRGNEPALGAVICWGKHGGAGHVAIVEQINPDGSIVTSESGWESNYNGGWWTQKRYKGLDGNWGLNSSYYFQGFIYCPLKTGGYDADENALKGNESEIATVAVNDTTQTSAITESMLCVKNSYSITMDEMKVNAQYIAQYFLQRGWTLNAVAGMLGNMQQESLFSPCIWEGCTSKHYYIDKSGIYHLNDSAWSFGGGFGLVGWTAARKFFEWCDPTLPKSKRKSDARNVNDTGRVLPWYKMDTQLKRIEAEVEASSKSWIEGLSQWIKRFGYTMTFKEFIQSTEEPEYLAKVFVNNYECPRAILNRGSDAAKCEATRGQYARFWYEYLSGMGGAVLGTFSIAEVQGVRLNGICMNKLTPVDAEISFLAKNVASGSYQLLLDEVVKKKVSLAVEDGLNIFKVDGLIPNNKYKVIIDVDGTDSRSLSETKEFITPQDYPSKISSISFLCNNIKNLNTTYTLNIKKPNYLGYYKTSSGYDLTLFVNGNKFKTLEINSVNDINEKNFDIQQKFNYTHSLDELIQLGVQTWVKNGNTKIYNLGGPVVSNSICFLTNSITPYLNIE